MVVDPGRVSWLYGSVWHRFTNSGSGSLGSRQSPRSDPRFDGGVFLGPAPASSVTGLVRCAVIAQVFTSTSTVIFQTFACDGEVMEGQRLLRADYRLSCDTPTHVWFQVYAGLMLVVRVCAAVAA